MIALNSTTWYVGSLRKIDESVMMKYWILDGIKVLIIILVAPNNSYV